MGTVATQGIPPRAFRELASELKAESRLTFAELASRTRAADDDGRGLSPSYITQVLNGVQPPVPRALVLIAKALDVDPKRFIEYRLHLARQLFDETVDFDAASKWLLRFDDAARAGNDLAAAIQTEPLAGSVGGGRQRQLRSRR